MITVSSLGSKTVSLSGLASGEQYIGDPMSYKNSFIELNEKRAINYRKYCELMKRNRIKVAIRENVEQNEEQDGECIDG